MVDKGAKSRNVPPVASLSAMYEECTRCIARYVSALYSITTFGNTAWKSFTSFPAVIADQAGEMIAADQDHHRKRTTARQSSGPCSTSSTTPPDYHLGRTLTRSPWSATVSLSALPFGPMRLLSTRTCYTDAFAPSQFALSLFMIHFILSRHNYGIMQFICTVHFASSLAYPRRASARHVFRV